MKEIKLSEIERFAGDEQEFIGFERVVTAPCRKCGQPVRLDTGRLFWTAPDSEKWLCDKCAEI